MTDRGPLGAYMDADLHVSGAAGGPLASLSFAAKDLFDVAGHISCCGSPDWGRTHGAASQHAKAVEKLLNAGASLNGKTITDEFAFSIVGENHHYGTPENPNAPGHVCGGSSSGSAAVVSGGRVDFALGTDTGGSVRVPASFCGIYGLRPTHGRVSLDGVFALAPSFDTAGWFARDPALMTQVGRVLLEGFADFAANASPTLLFPEDVWAEAEPDAVEALRTALAQVERHFGQVKTMRLTQDEETIDDWFDCFRIAQGAEIWSVLGGWITETQPNIGPGIKERLEWCSSLGQAERDRASEQRARIAARVHDVTRDGAILVMPVAPSHALRAGENAVRSNEVRAKIIKMSGIAPLAKTPQISLPIALVDGMPIALSLMGAPGQDETLLALAETIGGAAEDGVASISMG